MSISQNFNDMGLMVGFATFVQRITVGIGLLAFVILSIQNHEWYTPFIQLLIGLVVGSGINEVLVSFQIVRRSAEKGEVGIFFSSIITLVALLVMIYEQYIY